MDSLRFKNRETLKLFYGQRVKGFSGELAERAQNKLKLVFTAPRLDDLLYPAGNNLEKLGGDRKGQWSIRINKQWRICFYWRNGKAEEIDVVDYH